MINVSVDKNANENNLSVLRRFTKRVQGSGVLNRVRGIRYHSRNLSEYSRKKMTLKVLVTRAENERLMKLGKLKPVERRGR